MSSEHWVKRHIILGNITQCFSISWVAGISCDLPNIIKIGSTLLVIKLPKAKTHAKTDMYLVMTSERPKRNNRKDDASRYWYMNS